MTRDTNQASNAGAIRDPDDWKTGDEPITAAQRSYIQTLATEAGEAVDDEGLTKRDASKLIDELQEKTGRGNSGTKPARPHTMKDDKLPNEDEPLRTDEHDLTPPHGDSLREEVTFGRTDRYANLDDETATRERALDGRDPANRDTTE